MKSRLKWVVTAICIGLTVLPAWCVAAGQDEPQKQPVVSLPEETFVFDTVVEGNEILHDFAVKNTGEAPLEILKVQPG